MQQQDNGAPAEQDPGGLEQVDVNPIELVFGKLDGWAEQLVALIPNLIVALLVLALFWFLSKLARKVSYKALDRFVEHRSVVRLLSTTISFAVLAIGLFVALEAMQLSKAVTTILGGLGILGLALGFAFQDLTANFISGVMMSVRHPFEVDDVIETNDHFGTVELINLRTTVLRTPSGQRVLIPNKDVYGNPIVNYTSLGQRRVDLGVGVSYGDDLAKAKKLAIEAVEGIEARDEDREVELFYEEFGDSSINFVVRFWVPFEKQKDFLAARSEAIMRIKQAFDSGGITIPFPIRTLDFGVPGGVEIADALQPVMASRQSASASSPASPSGGDPS